MTMTSLPVYAAETPGPVWMAHWSFPAVAPHIPSEGTAAPSPAMRPMLRVKAGVPVSWPMLHLPGYTPSLSLLTDLFGTLPPVTALPVQATPSTLLQVSVGFADSSSASANFPEPWNETNPLVNFVGGGSQYRAGAVRLDNPTTSDITVDSVTVDLGRPGPAFQLWSAVRVPALGSAILTQTANGNFNTSASPIVSCGAPLAANDARIPKITISAGGTSTDFLDTAHVLDTGGFDSSCRGNQSLQWRPAGTAGIESPGGSLQLITENAPHAVGTQDVFTAAVMDAAGQPLANAPVTLKVLNGPNAGKTIRGVSDSSGTATLQYSSTVQGADLVQASVDNLSGGSLLSQQLSTTWTSADACPASASSNASATRLIYVGQSSTSFGNPLRLSALLTDGTGNPVSGRTVSFATGAQTFTATTDANGVASVAATLPTGDTQVTISYAGDAAFAPASLTTGVSVQPVATLLRYTGTNLLGDVGQQNVSAVLTDALGRSAVTGASVTFSLNGVTAAAVTDASGSASATLVINSAQPSGAAQLQISFPGNANYQASSRTVAIQLYDTMGFVIWGGNSGGLKIGQRVNFWGSQWESQVIDGQYFAANPSFKGWSGSIASIQQCQANATPATLTTACWQVKPGQSFPPSITLPAYIQVIVSTVISKAADTVYGNIACGAVVQVDHTPPYGTVPGQPGFGTITAVNGDCGGVFPPPAVIAASQQQATTVLPNQNVAVNYSIADQGATDASGVTLTESFDQASPATGSASIGTVAAGKSASGSFNITIPPVAARQQSESSVDYESRLAGSDGRSFTSEGEVSFTDPFGQLYTPVDFSSFSQLVLPRLSLALTGPSCIAPGTNVSYQSTISNIGTAAATQIAASLSLPDASTSTPVVPGISAGTSFVTTTQWQSPGIAAKDPAEPTQSYIARLQSADGTTLPAAVIHASWQDSLANQYGSVEQPFTSITQRLPIVTTTTPASPTLLPGQKSPLSFTVSNFGSGNAVQITLKLKRPDGSFIVLPNFSLPGGQNAVLSASFNNQPLAAKGIGETDAAYLARLAAANGITLNLNALLNWMDSAQNNYGPTDNPFTATQVLPVLNISLPASGEVIALPRQTVPVAFTVANSGNADAQQVVVKQGSTSQIIARITAGQSQAASFNFTAPAVAAKAAGEPDAAYLVRLQAADNQASSIPISLQWADAAGNSYGAISSTAQVVEQLPVLHVVLTAPALANAGDTISYVLTLSNSGHAAGTISNLTLTLPGGAVVHPVPASSVLAPGAATTASVSFSIPAQTVGPITGIASVSWTDANANAYGAVSSAAVTNVNSANLAPVVSAGTDQVIALPVTNATLNGSVSDDGRPVGGALTSLWTQVSGPTAIINSPSTPVTTVTLTATGTYIFRLTASDTQLSSSADVKVTLTPPNQPPVVNAGQAQTVTLPASAALHGSATDDGLPLGAAFTVLWSKVAGPGSVVFGDPSAASTQASFSAPGTYVLRLSASDTQFITDSDVTITVAALPATQLTVSAGPNQTVTFPGSVTLNGSVNDTSSVSASVQTNWSQVDGPGTTTFSNPTNPVTTATFSDPGTYVLRLSASDGLLSTSSDVTVFVGKLACARSNAGTDFWLVVGRSLGPVNETVTLNISGDQNTSGAISISALGFTQAFSVTAGQTTTVTIPSTVVMQTSDQIESKGIHVTSQLPVTVFVEDYIPTGGDGYSALPTSMLGTEYVTVGYKNSLGTNGFATLTASGSQFAFVATQDGTTVTVSPAQKTVSSLPNNTTSLHPARVPYQIKLNQGQTYQLSNFDTLSSAGTINADLTGSIITSDKPIAVVSGHRCAFVPGGQNFCNKIEEQLPPADLWGKNFVTMPFATRNTGGDLFRFVASQDQTHVTINGIPTATLDRGDFFEQSLASPSTIAADQPVLVAQISKGGSIDGIFNNFANTFTTVPGDPTMALVQPYDQFGGSYTYATPATGFDTHYVNVLAPTAGLDGAIQLDGVAIPKSSFTPIGNSALSGAQLPVSAGSHHLASTSIPFGITTYGFANADAYGYVGGSCMAREAIGTQVSISPKTLTSQVDTQSCATITSTDAGGAPLGGVGVNIEVTGVNPQKTSVQTDATGKANFCYTGTNAGSDLIKISSGHITDTATWTWTAATTNHAPIVNAGRDVTIFLPQNTVTLQGSVIDDGLPAGAQLSIHWDNLSAGLPPVIFSNPNSPVTQVLLSSAATGTYTFQLTGDDTQLVSTAIVHVTVQAANQPPAVSAGTPQTIYMQGTIASVSTTLQGRATDDGLPSGILTTQWSTLSGPAAVTFGNTGAAVTSATFPQPGVYVLALAASDSQLSTTASVQVTVLLNQPPVVTPAPNQTIVSAGATTATLSASISDDGLPLGNPLTIQWSTNSNAVITNPTQATTQVQLPRTDTTYVFGLQVSDGALTTGKTVIITVVSTPPVVPPPPTVSIASPADEADIHAPAQVIGSVSNGSWTLAYRLNNDDGAATTAFTTIATGTTPVNNGVLGTFDPSTLLNGLYTIRLSSTDSSGQTSFASVNVNVSRNRKLGFFTLSFNDLSVPMPGLPVQIVRTYDSRNRNNQGDFGQGWTLSIANIRLQKNRSFTSFWEETVDTSSLIPQYCVQSDNHKFVTITFPDGKVYKFEAGLSPQCQLAGPITSPVLSFTQVTGEAGTEGATLVTADGVLPLIDGSVPGTFNLIQPDGTLYNPTLFKLTTAEGFSYIIDQTKGVLGISDLNGNTLTITPDGVIHSSGKSILFHRDLQGHITSITDPQGNNIYYGYNPDTGDLQSFTDAQANTTTFFYANQPAHLLQSITDARGVTVLQNVWTGPNGDQLFETLDANRNAILYNIQQASNQETITDRLGNPTTYTYDNDGNVTTMVNALGQRTDYSYDPAGNKLTETRTDDAGRAITTTFAYDTQSNLTSETDALGNVTRYAYDAHRRVTSITDPRGKITSNAYDTKGNLLTTTDPLGNVTTYAYFPNGLPQTVTDANHKVTSFGYDANGNLTQQTDALGNVTSYTYDANNNKSTQTVTRTRADGTRESLTTAYVYDGSNRLIKTINPDGSNAQVSYNSLGKQASTTDANGNVTSYTYDANGRMTTVTYADLTQDIIAYDNEGRRTSIRPHGRPGPSYTYDKLGRLIQTQYPTGGIVTTVYDALGRVKSTTDQRNNATTYTYDDAGRRLTSTDALGHITRFNYDAAGNQTTMTDANTHVTTYVYDDAGRRTQTIFHDQSTETIAYDALGRQISRTDQAGKLTQFAYDALGRLTSVTDALGQVTFYGYDELGNRVSQTDANGHTTSFAYDRLGRRSSRTLPMGQSESYGYDAAGNLNSRTDFNGHTTTYAYDNMNRLASKTADAFFSQGACAGGACGATRVAFTYTATGKRATMDDAVGHWVYTYDVADRLTDKSLPGFNNFSVHWDYDLADNITGMSSANTTASYGYDALNRLQTATNLRIPQTMTYTYDAVGNLSGAQLGTVVNTSYIYDPLNRLTSMQTACVVASGCGSAGRAISSYNYTLGAAGNRLSVQELSGRTVQYGYDDLYRLTSESISGALSQNGAIGYSYDPVGNRKQISSTVPAIPASGLLNYDPNDRTATDVYDANGNLTNNGLGNVYDFENHLVQRGNVTIAYDGDGNRVKETVAGVNNFYLLADMNPTGYVQVLEERSNSANSSTVTRTYTYGLQPIGAQRSTTGLPISYYYGLDGHGSVRYLLNTTGQITDTYDYDAFGNLIVQTGTTPNNVLFAGEQFDPALGIYYNRARYYDQRQGRFWTMDGYEGNIFDPHTLHRYLYASVDPINRTDPSGNEDITEVTFVAGEENTVSGVDAEAKNEARRKVINELKPVVLVHVTSATQADVINSFGLSARLYPEIGDIQGRLAGAFFVIRPAANPQFAFQAIVQFAAAFAENRFRGQALVAMVGELPQAVFDTLKLEGAIVDDYLGGVLGNACLPASFATIDEFNVGRWIVIPLVP